LIKGGELEIIPTKATHIRVVKYDYYLNDDFSLKMGNAWDKDGTRESLNNNDNNDKNNIYTLADLQSADEALEAILEDKDYLNEIMNRFSINEEQLESEFDHMRNDYIQKGKSTKDWKASLKVWMHYRKKNLDDYWRRKYEKTLAYEK